MAQMNLSMKLTEAHRDREQTWGAKRRWGGMDCDFGVSGCKLLHIE